MALTKRVFVAGLALDFCVHYTAIDSAILGYKTFVIKDATLPVNVGNSVEETINNFKKNNVGYGKLEEFIWFFNHSINLYESHSIIPSTLAKDIRLLLKINVVGSPLSEKFLEIILL